MIFHSSVSFRILGLGFTSTFSPVQLFSNPSYLHTVRFLLVVVSFSWICRLISYTFPCSLSLLHIIYTHFTSLSTQNVIYSLPVYTYTHNATKAVWQRLPIPVCIYISWLFWILLRNWIQTKSSYVFTSTRYYLPLVCEIHRMCLLYMSIFSVLLRPSLLLSVFDCGHWLAQCCLVAINPVAR